MRLLSFYLLSAIRVVSSAYLRLLVFLPAILIQFVLHSVQRFSYSAYKLNKQISRVTIYSLDILLSRFGTNLVFRVAVVASGMEKVSFHSNREEVQVSSLVLLRLFATP